MTQRYGLLSFQLSTGIQQILFQHDDFEWQVNTAKAEAEMAYQLQASKVNARIKEEEMQVGLVQPKSVKNETTNKLKVVEREQQIAIQQQEIQRKEKELNSKVRFYQNKYSIKAQNRLLKTPFSRSELPLRQRSIVWRRLQRQRRAGRCWKLRLR